MTIEIRRFSGNHLLNDIILERPAKLTKEEAAASSLTEICKEWDIPVPIWLKTNRKELEKTSKTRFRQDHFIETIDFDYLEVTVTENLI